MAELSEATVNKLNRMLEDTNKSLEPISAYMKEMLKRKFPDLTQTLNDNSKATKANTDTVKNESKARKTATSTIHEEIQAARKKIEKETEYIDKIENVNERHEAYIDWYDSVLRNRKNLSVIEQRAHRNFIHEKLNEQQGSRNSLKLHQQWNDSIAMWKDSLIIKGMRLFRNMDAWSKIVEGARKSGKELHLSIQTGIPLLNDYFTSAYNLAMTPEEVIQFKKQNARAAAAWSGGLTEFVDITSDVGDKLMDTGITADKQQSRKIAGDLLRLTQSFGLSTDKARKLVEGDLMKTMKTLQTNIGMTGEEFVEMTKSILEDNEQRELMLRLNEDQIGQYIQTQAALQNFLITTQKFHPEQAKAVTDLLKKMGGETAKDRLRRSLRTQALMGIMGVSGGEQLAAEMRKAPGKRDESFIAEKLGELSKASEGMKGAGFAQELMVDALNEGTGGIINEARVTNNTLNEKLENLNETTSRTETAIKDGFAEANKLLGGIPQAINSGGGTMMQGLAMGIIGGVLAGPITKGLGKLLGGAVSKGGGGFFGNIFSTVRSGGGGKGGLAPGVQIPGPINPELLTVERNRTQIIRDAMGNMTDKMSVFADKAKHTFTLMGKQFVNSTASSASSVGKWGLSMAQRHPLIVTGAAGLAIGTALDQAIGISDYIGKMGGRDIEKESKERQKKMDEETARLLKQRDEALAAQGKTKDELSSRKEQEAEKTQAKQREKQVDARQIDMTNALQQLVQLQAENNRMSAAILETNKDAADAFKKNKHHTGGILVSANY